MLKIYCLLFLSLYQDGGEGGGGGAAARGRKGEVFFSIYQDGGGGGGREGGMIIVQFGLMTTFMSNLISDITMLTLVLP